MAFFAVCIVTLIYVNYGTCSEFLLSWYALVFCLKRKCLETLGGACQVAVILHISACSSSARSAYCMMRGILGTAATSNVGR